MSPLRTGHCLLAVCSLVLAACSSPPAPIEERDTTARTYALSKSGRYLVRRGDTLYSIAFNYGLDWKEVAAWNGIASPYTIWPGQELALVAPRRGLEAGTATATTTTVRPAGKSPKAVTRPVEPEAPPTSISRATTLPAPAVTRSMPPAPAAQQSKPALANTPPNQWLWPTHGDVFSRFKADDPARKGIDIRGTEGQDIVASAPGEVVYSGNGLIGFGELIIIKHTDSMLTAYAHNSNRLVQEGDRVEAGSKIAEMGRNGQNQSMLHFELRVNGKPVDPLQYLTPP